MGATHSTDSYGGLIGTGLLMGIIHVLTGPDHLSAVAAMTAGTSHRKAFFDGCRWGMGHSTGLLLIAFIFLGVGEDGMNLETVGIYCDWIVGFLMIALGVYTVWKAYQIKAHEEQFAAASAAKEEGAAASAAADDSVRGGIGVNLEANRDVCPFFTTVPVADMVREEHPSLLHQSEVKEDGHDEGRLSTSPTSSSIRDSKTKEEEEKDMHARIAKTNRWMAIKERMISFCVGVVHGIAGPGGILGVLPAVQLHNWAKAMTYLLTFCISSILAMGVFGAIYGEATRRAGRGKNRLNHYLRLFSASLSMIVGIVWIILSAMGKLGEVFG